MTVPWVPRPKSRLRPLLEPPLERPRRPPLTIRAGARPFETSVMVGGFIAGVAGVTTPEARSKVIAASFGAGTVAWYVSLLLWCGVVLVAVVPQAVSAARQGWSTLVHPRGVTHLALRLRVEQAGMLGFSGTVVAYGVAALTYTGVSAATAAIWIALFGVAALWRAGEIQVDLRKLTRAHNNPHPAYPIPLGDPRGGRG